MATENGLADRSTSTRVDHIQLPATERDEPLAEGDANFPHQGIAHPEPQDVLYGRGVQHHEGNKKFQKMVKEQKVHYAKGTKLKKLLIEEDIISRLRAQDPPVRFLIKVYPELDLWIDVGNKVFTKKLRRALNYRGDCLDPAPQEEPPQDASIADESLNTGSVELLSEMETSMGAMSLVNVTPAPPLMPSPPVTRTTTSTSYPREERALPPPIIYLSALQTPISNNHVCSGREDGLTQDDDAQSLASSPYVPTATAIVVDEVTTEEERSILDVDILECFAVEEPFNSKMDESASENGRLFCGDGTTASGDSCKQWSLESDDSVIAAFVLALSDGDDMSDEELESMSCGTATMIPSNHVACASADEPSSSSIF